MIHRAIVKSGRMMVLSLSPGPAPLDKAAEVAANAQLWRISDDVWDRWERLANEHNAQCSIICVRSGLTFCLLVSFQRLKVEWNASSIALPIPPAHPQWNSIPPPR